MKRGGGKNPTAMTAKRSVFLLLLILTTAQSYKDRIQEYRTDQFSQKEKDEVKQVIDQVAGFEGGPIIRPFQPQRWWLWQQWSGTMLKEGLPSVAINMFGTFLLATGLRKATGESWAVGLKPDISNPIIARMAVFDDVWKYLMTLTTFILTFFVGESYSLWKNMYTIGRKVQGRLNDISLLVATHAKRDKNGKYTREAEALLDSVAMNIRALHILLWAACSRHYNSLLTEQGSIQMVEQGILTETEANILASLDLRLTHRHDACLEWIMIQIQDAMQKGILVGGDPLKLIVLDKCCELRATYGTIGDVLDGRMPLAYAHLVQILVDSLVFCAPFALYAELGDFSIISVGLLTLFYSGLLVLAKVFLDPLDNEDYCQESVKIDLSVLIRESNAGSIRWKNAAETLPFSNHRRR